MTLRLPLLDVMLFVLQVTQSFEVYAAFAPTMTKAAAIEAVNKLLRWCKKEESSLFILNAPTI